MNKKITASLCAILFLLAGCVKKEEPSDLQVAPENAPVVVDPAAPANKVEVRKQVTVLATQSPCWVKVDKVWVNINHVERLIARHSIEQYGVLMVMPKEADEFIPTDNPEGVIDEMMNQTQTCGKQT